MEKQDGAVLVSVVMPAYNAQAHIRAAVESVLAQTVTDWELLVIDDGSSDETVSILNELALVDPRIRFLQNERNMGCASTRNRGLELSRGRFVALLDSDDVWHPDKLERQLALMQNQAADVCYTSYAIVDEQGETLGNDFIVAPQTDLKAMLKRSEIGCSTAMVTAQIAQDYRFSTEYYHEDYALWLAILKDGKKAVGLTEVLVDYRMRRASRASNKLASAARRWHIYRHFLGCSVWSSCWYSAQYAVAGLKKYKKV